MRITGRIMGIVALGLLATQAIAQQWVTIGTLPTPRADMASVVLGDTLYLIGGSVPGTTSPVASADVVRFNLDGWLLMGSAPSLNLARISPEAVFYQGWILVFGGRYADSYCSEVEIWRPGEPAWQIAGTLAPARSGMRAMVLNDTLYVTGGTSGPLQPHNRIDRIQLDEEGPYPLITVHETSDTLPEPRSHHRIAVLDGETYLFGGFSLWPLTDSYRLTSGGWEPLSDMLVGVGGMAVTPFVIQQSPMLVITGGRAADGEVAAVQLLRGDGLWFELGYFVPLQTARAGHAQIARPWGNDTTLAVFGGSYENISGQKVLLNDISIYERHSTATTGESPRQHPQGFGLSAYPNPSNGEVTIQLLADGTTNPLDLRIFDLLGRQVSQWSLPPGREITTLSWNARQDGRELGGGIYFLVARQGERQQVLKLFRMP